MDYDQFKTSGSDAHSRKALHAFSKCNRLSGQNVFQSVFAQAQRISHANLQAYFCINKKQDGISRIGIIIKKHIVKSAVMRNQLRRIIRESFRHAKHNQTLRQLDIIVVHRSQPLTDWDPKIFRTTVDSLWTSIAHQINCSLAMRARA